MSVHTLCLPLAIVSLAFAAAEAPEVPVSRPAPREVTDYEVFPGRAAASRTVEVRARVSGYLTKVTFKDGSEVKQGDLLFEIDPRPYRAELEKAQAGVALAKARLKQADVEYQGARALAGQKTVGRPELDRASGRREEAEAGLRAAQASLDAARLTLDFTQVHAPMDGRISRRRLDPGNLVKADDTPLATLVAADPLYVYFDVDEPTLRRLEKEKAPGTAPVAVRLGGEDGYPHEGRIDFVDNRVGPDKSTVQARAVLPNPGGRLRPGQFAWVRVAAGEPYRALLVPEAAVWSVGGRKFVYVVNDKDVLEARPVTLGQREGESVAVKGGLKATDRVVVGGLQQLRAGMTVQTRPAPGARKEGR